MKVVRVARTILRDAFPLVVDRLTAAGSLGAMALSIAGVESPDLTRFILAWAGAGGALYAILVWGRAPDDPDLPPA